VLGQTLMNLFQQKCHFLCKRNRKESTLWDTWSSVTAPVLKTSLWENGSSKV